MMRTPPSNREIADRTCRQRVAPEGREANAEGDRHQLSGDVRRVRAANTRPTVLADFPMESWFVTVTVKGRNCWYFDLPTPEGKDKRSYMGLYGDAEITARAKTIRRSRTL